MTAPRQILPGRTILLTRRCTQRQFLLRPDAKTVAIFAYCLGDAARRSEIELIAWCVMSNHYHAVVYDRHGRLPEFLEHLHKMVARVLNAHWGRRENLWSTDQTCVTYLATPEAVFEKVCYVLANPAAAHLVDRLFDWPGCTSLHHLDGRTTQHKRPTGFFRDEGPNPEQVELRAMQPPCSKLIESGAKWSARVRERIAEIERDLRAQRLRDGTRVVGRKAVRATSPFDAPKTVEAKRKLRPTIACRDPRVRKLELRNLIAFLTSYREARLRYIAGEHDVEFPAGTYRLRLWGANCAPLPALAIAA